MTVQIVNSISLLAIILCGAAVIRKREHGTIEHLLVMPLRPVEIMFAKVWANGLVIVAGPMLSLLLVVGWALQVPIAGSLPLFLVGTVLYVFAATALGIFLATLVRSMPQFGLLALPVYIVPHMLSGGMTQHATDVTAHHAYLTVDALRELRAGSALSWRSN